MNVEILPSARDDLSMGFEFYEKQGAGMGAYFLDSLRGYAGTHRMILNHHRLLSSRFPWRFITVSKAMSFVSAQQLTAAEVPIG